MQNLAWNTVRIQEYLSEPWRSAGTGHRYRETLILSIGDLIPTTGRASRGSRRDSRWRDLYGPHHERRRVASWQIVLVYKTLETLHGMTQAVQAMHICLHHFSGPASLGTRVTNYHAWWPKDADSTPGAKAESRLSCRRNRWRESMVALPSDCPAAYSDGLAMTPSHPA